MNDLAAFFLTVHRLRREPDALLGAPRPRPARPFPVRRPFGRPVEDA